MKDTAPSENKTPNKRHVENNTPSNNHFLFRNLELEPEKQTDSLPIHQFVDSMISNNPALRPKINEVVAFLINPDNYSEFKKLYRFIFEYKEYLVDKQLPNTIYRNDCISMDMIDTIESTLKQYRIATPQDDIEKTLLVNKTTDKIFSVMEDLVRQNNKEDSKENIASSGAFNAGIIRSLPGELGKSLCKKLGIHENDPLFKKESLNPRFQKKYLNDLTNKISGHSEPHLVGDGVSSPN
jgi:hypothetical protein